jgi:trimeric autotransporter adhesin
MRRFVFLFPSLLLLTHLSSAQQLWVITTYAGGGPNHGALDGSVGFISGLATDSSGNVYISSDVYENAILEVAGGNVFRVAGANAQAGVYVGDGGPATLAVLPSQRTVGVDSSGQIFIPDWVTNHIYKVDTNGIISMIAGNGALKPGTPHNCGFDGDGPALQHSLCVPWQVVPDGHGNILVADAGNCAVRKIDSEGNMTTVAGVGPTIYGTCLAYDGEGLATSFTVSPAGIALDASGNLYISDEPNNRIRKVDAGGNMTTVAGNGVASFGGDGGPATAASLYDPNGVAVDTAGNLYIMDITNLRVRKVDTSGNISTVAGNGGNCTLDAGPALQEGVCGEWVAVDPAGNLYVDQSQAGIIKIDTSGNLTLFAGNGTPYDLPNGMVATQASLLNPVSVATDPSGNVYFTEVADHLFDPLGPVKITSSGATSLMSYGCLSAVDAAGNVYCALATQNEVVEYYPSGTQTVVAGTGIGDGLCSFNGDGTATTHSVCTPGGVAVDSLGDLFIADTNNCRVRKVDTSGNMSTIAGDGLCTYDGDGPATAHALNSPGAVAVDGAGNVYIADTGNNRVRQVSADGSTMTTIAGNGMLLSGQCVFDGDGPATQHSLCSPNSIATDSAGDVFVLDSGSVRIREISGSTMSTVAGNGQSTFVGENSPAASASFDHPTSIAVDSNGNLYVADEYNNRIRKIAQTSDFVIAPSQTKLTLTAGGSGMIVLQVTSGNAFSGTVTFTCTGAPKGSTCTALPSSATVSGGSASTTFTITTTGASSADVRAFWPGNRTGSPWLPIGLALACLSLLSFKKKRLPRFAPVVLLLATACGGGSTPINMGGVEPTTTPAGSYTLQLSAASSGATQSTTVQLIVN